MSLSLNIPANPEYSSLNLAMAVQLVSYEMRMAFFSQRENGKYTFNNRKYLSNSTRKWNVFFAHTEQVYKSLGFIQNQGVMQKLRRLYNRSSLEKMN